MKSNIKLYQRKIETLKIKVKDYFLVKLYGREYLVDFVMDNYKDWIDDIYNEPPEYDEDYRMDRD